MPPARSASAAPRRHSRSDPRRQQRRAPQRPQRVALRPPRLRVRWERLGRIGLLCVLAIVVGLYAEHAISYFSTRSQANAQQSVVTNLEHQNAQLSRQLKSLNDPATIVRDARTLGMIRPGERSYAMTGKPQR